MSRTLDVFHAPMGSSIETFGIIECITHVAHFRDVRIIDGTKTISGVQIYVCPDIKAETDICLFAVLWGRGWFIF